MSAASRRGRGLAGLVLATGLAWLAHATLDVSLRSVSFASGWLLLALVALLALFNLRKKLPFLRLGSARAWLALHAWAGLFALLVFLAHVDFSLPRGPFEQILGLAFLLVSVSGVVGLLLSRWLPIRMTTRGEAILFERIPSLRRRLREETEELVLESAREVQTTTISDFYGERLADFFQGPRNLWFHLLDSPRPARDLEGELDALDRYANPREREILAEIRERVRAKDDLDYQWAQQLALKGWLFLHIPVSYAMLIAIAIHVLLVYGFSSG